MSLEADIAQAIAAGRCSLAVSESLVRDADVALALKQRGAMSPMALAGKVVAPVVEVNATAVARSATPKGILVIVDPGQGDQIGMQKLSDLLKAAGGAPRIVVVSKSPDKFGIMRLFGKVDYVSERGKAWIAALPVPPAEAAAPAAAPGEQAKAPKKAAESAGPRFVFTGRDEEVEHLAGLLAEGGPVVISGPAGIGRTAVVDHAAEKAGLTRAPDLTLGRGVGADALFARLAELTRGAGSSALFDCLSGPHTPAQAVEAAITSLKEASLADTAFVVRGLHVATGREGDFFRKSRLELLCEALLTNTYSLRLIFLSAVQPRFFREGRDAGLRRVELSGIKGRFYYDIFEAMGAGDVSRDRFGPMSERLHGHPLAVRMAAHAIKANPALADDDRFFKMTDASDVDVIKKQIEKRLEKVAPALRALLARAAHLRYPVEASVLQDLDISKKDRQALVAEGLLDMAGTEANKRYGVHPLVRGVMDLREVSDFDTSMEIARRFKKIADGATGVQKLHWTQEVNRYLVEARNSRDLLATELPDQDGLVESCIGLLRGKTPRPDVAFARLQDVLKRDPANADAWLLLIELYRRSEGKDKECQEAIDQALEKAPVPEVYHEAVGFWLARNNRNKAIKVLEDAIVALPDHSRLRTRLASLLLRAGRRTEAIDQLKLAMDQDPMLPDAYGLLGMARREEGAEKLEEAETLLREAMRLAPNDIVQTSRLIWLLLDIARGVPEREAAIREELRALVDALLAHDKKSAEAHFLFAVVLREEGADYNRAAWFLKQARKLSPNTRGSMLGRFDIEEALIDIGLGKLDDAEVRLRRQEKRDASNPRIYAAISKVLEARGQLVAAWHELRRAMERCAPNSLDLYNYEIGAARLQAAIEAGAGVVPEYVPEGVQPVEAHAGDELDAPASGEADAAAPASDESDATPPAEESVFDAPVPDAEAPAADEPAGD